MGRPKGAKDLKPRNTAARASAATMSAEAGLQPGGILPVPVMLEILRRRWERNDEDGTLEVAGMVAPYIHAKLAAVQHSGDAADPITVVIRRLSEADA